MAGTKLGPKRIHLVRARGGNIKRRAMRLDSGVFGWASEATTCPVRLFGVVYNASNNELVRTNTLVKGAVVHVDATPFKQWYERTYKGSLGKKKKADKPKKDAPKLEEHFSDQFAQGRLLAKISSRPGQTGRVDGYILEGKELDFYLKKIKHKK